MTKLSNVLTPEKYSGGEQRLIRFLEGLPDDEILTFGEVRDSGFSDRIAKSLRKDLVDLGLAVQDNLSRVIYHGNKRVIAQFKASRGIE